MATYLLPYFGEINYTALDDDFYDIEIELEGNKIDIDLNFENESIEETKMKNIKNFLEKLTIFDTQNKARIKQEWLDDIEGYVNWYLIHHLEELNEADLSGLVDFDNEDIEPEVQLLAKLRLVRVGLYPISDDKFAVFDYSIGRDLTDDLLVIVTNKNGEFDHITCES
jgi:Protein of unknown function (DUF2004)